MKETFEHEFTDLSHSSRDRIAVALLDAEGILRFSQAEADYLADQASKLGFDSSGVNYSPGSLLMESALGESDTGRQRSARHLLAAVAIEYWKLLKPDVEQFRAKLNSIVGPIARRNGLEPPVLDVHVRYLEALTLREGGRLAGSSLAGEKEPPIRLSKETARTLCASLTPLKNSEAAVNIYNQSSFLVSRAQQRLDRRNSQRDDQLGQLIEIAAMRLRTLQENLGKGGADDRSCESKSMEMQLRSETEDLRQEMVGLAQTAASAAVREFATVLLLFPCSPELYSDLVRDYTGRVVSDIREALGTSQIFQIDPLLPWPKDPIAQEAIRFCEDTLAKRAQTEDGADLAVELKGHEPRTWAPVVQEWEFLKSIRERAAGPRERIPESDLRRIIAEQSGAQPEDISEAQIEQAAFELCRHYRSFLMIPLASSELRPAADRSPYSAAIPDAAFWKEREDEFRKHDTGHNTVLAASRSSFSHTWRYEASGSTHSPSAESTQLFKSLAREAAKGLSGTQGVASWVDWLDLLRSAKDEVAGQLLYAQVTTSSCVVIEVGRDRMVRDGEALPAGAALIEFGQGTDGVERRLYWDISSVKIENLFRSSANLCLELRSLAGHTLQRTEDVAATEHVSETSAILYEDLEASVTSVPATDSEMDGNGPTTPQAKPTTIISAHKSMKLTTWEGIEIRLLSDHRVQIFAGGESEVRNYAEMGFEDRRTEKPSRLWTLLLSLMASEGTLPTPQKTGKEWMAIYKRIERVRKILQKHFGLKGDPMPYIEGVGYRTRFKVSRALAADT